MDTKPYKVNLVLTYDTEATSEKEALDELRNIINKHIPTIIFEVESVKATEIQPETKCLLCKQERELKGGICKECVDNFSKEYDRKKAENLK